MSAVFNTTLLREKFILHDAEAGMVSDAPPVIALSNRMVLTLVSKSGKETENFVVRTQNMHSCVRASAAIAREFMERGSLTKRITKFHWDNLWHDVIKGYEKDWNPDIWAAFYHNGRVVYEFGTRHPLLDIIEKCNAVNGGEYEKSLPYAEDAFSQAGKPVKLEYDSNIALVVNISPKEAKCGVIIRGANKKTTFNFIATPFNSNRPIRVPTVMTVCAAFLEGIQLAFQVGLMNKKRENRLFEEHSDEDRKAKRSTERLANLNRAITRFEEGCNVVYRPERPDLPKMAEEAEGAAMKILAPQIRKKLQAGDLNKDDWVE